MPCYNDVMIISVIIPVFNAQKYIDRCIDSVIRSLEKSKQKYEVIAVDNGSADKSLDILHKKAQKNKKIIVKVCENPGAAAARNFGAKLARGKYIWFIDADDEITENSASLLIEKAEETDAEFVMMGATRIYSDGHTDYLSAVKANASNTKSRFIRYGAGPWQFLIRRDWWQKNNFLFQEGLIHEDMELMSVLILYTNKFSSVDKPLYLYYQNDGSILHKKEFDPHIFDIFPVLESLYNRFEKIGATEKYHDELEWFFIWNLLIDAAKDFGKFPEGKPGFKRSREMMKSYFPNWRKNRFLKEKSLKLRIKIRLNYLA